MQSYKSFKYPNKKLFSNEKKLKALEEKKADEVEVAAQKDEKRKKKETAAKISKKLKGGNMTIVGFNFTKLVAEKKDVVKGKINVSNNVAIGKVEEKNISLANDKQKVLAFTFNFTSKYEPDIGSINFIGDILLMEEAKKAKEILDGWKKDKKLPREIMTGILNTILNKCNIQALILSEQINLPAPIPLPKLQPAQKQD